MKSANVQARLKRAMREGSLTVADLSTWFGRDYHTVRTWVTKGRTPWGPNGDEARRLLALLEAAISKKRSFPVPINLSPVMRRTYMRWLRYDLDSRLSQARPAR